MLSFTEWQRENGYRPEPCDCGGPQYDTEHARDCAYEVSSLDLMDLYGDYCSEDVQGEDE